MKSFIIIVGLLVTLFIPILFQAETYITLPGSYYQYNYINYIAHKGDNNIVHWPTGQISWYLNINGAPGFDYPTTQSIITNAYSAWQSSNSNLSFNYVTSTTSTYGYDNHNVHSWVDGNDPILGGSGT